MYMQILQNLKKIIIWQPKYNDIKLIIQSAIQWEKKLKTNFYRNF